MLHLRHEPTTLCLVIELFIIYYLSKCIFIYFSIFNLGNKLEDKDKIIQYLKDEIEEFLKPKESTHKSNVDNDLKIKKLTQDLLDLEISNHELKQQLKELENKHDDLNGKVIKLCFTYILFIITVNFDIKCLHYL